MITRVQVLVFLATIILVDSINANPVGGVVASGNVVITQTTGNTQIQQNSQQAIINWQSFNIGAGEKTHFQQPEGGVALNRISPTQGPSQIYGQLTATGKIILVNQSGIFFGPGSYVHVGGIIASTSGITDANFLAGKYIFNQASPFNGSVINKGTIVAAQNGLVALVGTGVSNEGTIQARTGNVVLASGNKFTVDLFGDQLINFAIDEGTSNAGVDENGNKLKNGVNNSGTIIADGGTIQMTAKTASSVVDHVINMDGVVQANTVSQKNGVIILGTGNEGSVRVAGKVYASGKQAGQKGGKVKILAKNVQVETPAVIDVSGDVGGGEILIGGNYQGKGPELNALTTYVGSGAKLNADAITNGDGGKIIAWADDATYFHGSISARGGISGGNGGFVETSGHNYLAVSGTQIDLTANKGVTGTWLLDPADLTICSSCTTTADSSVSGYYSSTGSNSNLLNTDLQTALASSSIIVQTTSSGSGGNGDIIISAPITWSSANSLTLTAYRNITSSGTITNTGGGSVSLIADNTGTGTGTVSFSAGNVSLSGGSGTVKVFYNPTTFGTQDTIYTGGTAPTSYMLINSLGAATDTGGTTNTRSLATVSNTSTYWSGNFALSKNIDASGTSSWNSGAGFVPMGNSTTNYSGAFDGQNFTISGLTINRTSGDMGLFGDTNASSSIRNINLTNASLTYTGSVQVAAGLLVGSSFGIISNAYTQGTLTGLVTNNLLFAGGLVGFNNGSGSITNSGANVNLNVTYSGSSTSARVQVGGFTGVNGPSASVTRSYSLGNVSVTSNTTVAGSYANIGGFVGLTQSPNDNNNYSRGNVTYTVNSGKVAATSVNVGGFAGSLNQTNANISKAFSSGTVTSNVAGNVGGFLGLNSGTTTMSDNYWDSTTAGQASGVGTGTATGVTGAATSAMQTQSTFTNWDFATPIWTMVVTLSPNSGFTYPHLAMENAYAIQGSAASGSVNNYIYVNGSSTPLGTYATNGNGQYAFVYRPIELPSGSNVLVVSKDGSNNVLGNTVFQTNGTTATANIQSGYVIAGVSGGVAITNSILNSAYNATNALYSLSGNNITINSNNNFEVDSAYTLNGNVTTSGTGAQLYNGALTLSADSTMTAANTSITFNNTLDGAQNLNIAAGTGTVTLSGIVGGSTPLTSLLIGANTTNINTSGITTTGTQTYNSLMTIGSPAVLTGSTLSFSNPLTLNSSLTLANSLATSISNAIGGAGGLTKSGAGTLTLSGANTYTGVTTISAGTLALSGSGSIATSSNVANSGTFDISGTSSGASIITMSGSGGVTLGSQILSLTAATNVDGNYTGVMSGTNGGINLTGTKTFTNANTYTGTTTINGSSSLILSGSGSISNSSSVAIANGGTFDISGTTSGTSIVSMSGAGGISLGSKTLTVSHGAGTTYSGVMADGGVSGGTGGGFTLSFGNLTLSGANTYTGATNINTIGLLTIQNNSALGTTAGATTIASGGTLQIDGSLSSLSIGEAITLSGSGVSLAGAISNLVNNNTLTGALTLANSSGARISSAAGTLTITGGVTGATFPLTIAGNGNTTFSTTAIATGTGTLTKIGAGTLTLNAANTYSGATILTTGITIAANNNSFGTSAVTVNTGASLQVNSGITLPSSNNISILGTGVAGTNGALFGSGSGVSGVNGIITLTGSATIGAGSNNTILLSGASVNNGGFLLRTNPNVTGGTVVLSEGISGSGGLLNVGGGTVQLSAANTYTGATNISAGTLIASDANALGTTASGTTVSAGATLNINGVAIGEDITLSGGTITGTGTSSISGAIGLTANSFLSGTGALTLSGIISGNTFGLTKSGSGTVTLSGTNTFTGVININAGILSVATIGNGGVAGNLGQATNDVGNLVLGGGTLQYTGIAASTDRAFTLTNSTTSTFDITNALTISGSSAASTGALTKTGSGTLILSGSNAYDGLTTVSAGLLTVQNSSALGTTVGATTVVNGAALQIDGSGLSIGEAITIDGTDISSGGALINLANSNTLSGAITLGADGARINSSAGTLTLTGGITGGGYALTLGGNGNTTVSINAITGSGTTLTKDGTGVLLLSAVNTYTGLTSVNAGTLRLGASGVIADNSAVTLANVSGVIFDLNSNSEAIGTLTGGAASQITLGTGATLTINQSSDATQAGVISGTNSAIVKAGNSALTLSGTNTYSGGTTVSAGTLNINNASGLGSTNGAVSVFSGATLSINNVTVGANPLTLNDVGVGAAGALLGTGTASYGGTISLASTSNIGVASGATLMLSGVISGANTNSLVKVGSGTLSLNGVNTYNGLTNITAGTVNISNSSSLGSATGSTTVGSGATLNFNFNNLTINDNFNLNGGTIISNLANNLINSTVTLGADSTISNSVIFTINSIAGSFGFTKIGGGELDLSAASHSGGTTINAGTLSYYGSGNIGSGSVTLNSSTLILNNLATLSNNFTINSGGATLQNANYNVTLSGIISGAGGFTKTGAAILALSGTNTYQGNTVINAGTLRILNNSGLGDVAGSTTVNSGTLQLNGVAIGAETINLNGGTLQTLTSASVAGNIVLGANSSIDTGAGGITLSGIVSGLSSFSLTKINTSTLILSGANTYSGATNVSAGKISIQNAAGLGNTSAVTVSSGAALDFNFSAGTLSLATDRNINLLGTGISNTGALTITGTNDVINNPIVLQGATTIGATGSGTLGGVISGSNSLTKVGAGTIILAGVNTYTGATNINSGTLSITNIANGGIASNLGASSNSAANLVLSGGTLQYTGATALTDRSFTLTAATTSTIDITNGLTINGAAASTSGALTKAGNGTLTLTGANAYTGITTISAGTLALSGSGSISNSKLIDNGIFDMSGAASGISIPSLSGNGNVLLGANTLTLTNASDTFAGVMSGTGGFTLAGGTETLMNTNTYSGSTLINAGTLTMYAGSGLPNSDITNNVNGAFQTVYDLGIDTLYSNPITIRSISGAGAITVYGQLNITNATGTISGTLTGPYNGYVYPNIITIMGGTQTLSSINYNYYSDIHINDGATLKYTGTQVGFYGQAIVDGTLLIDPNGVDYPVVGYITGHGNILMNSIGLALSNDDNYHSTAQNPVPYFSGVISGSGNLVLNNDHQQLGGVNTYTGPTTIYDSSGIILSGNGSISNSSKINFASSTASFSIKNISTSETSIQSIAGATGLIDLGAHTLTITNAADTFAGKISSFGYSTDGAIKLLGGNLTLTNATSDYGGGTYILGGTLTASSLAANGTASSLGIGNISISGDGTLAYSGGTVSGVNRAITIGAGGGTLQMTNPTASTLSLTGGITIGSNPLTTNISGNSASVLDISTLPITGSGSLTVSGLGTTALNADNSSSYTGSNINIASGTLSIMGGNSLPNANITNNGSFVIPALNYVPVIINSISGPGTIALNNHRLQINNASGLISGSITGTWSLNIPSQIYIMSGEQDISSDGINFTGDIYVNNGATLKLSGGARLMSSIIDDGTLISDGPSPYSFIGSLWGSGNVILNSDLYIANAVNKDSGSFPDFSGVISGSHGLVILSQFSNQYSNQILSGVNTYTGTTTMLSGLLALSGNGSIANSSQVVLTSPDVSVLDISGLSVGVSGTSANEGFIQSLTGQGNVILGNKTLTITNANDTFDGVIYDDPYAIITGGSIKLLAGALTLTNGASNYSGGTYIQGGTLTVGALSSSGSASPIGTGNISISGGGTLAYSGGTVSGMNRAITIGTGGGTLQTTNSSATTLGLTGGINLGTNSFTLNADGNSASAINISTAAITGSGSITKSGAGTVGISVANPSFTGNINITAGTLALTGSGAIDNSIVTNDSVFDISSTTSGAALVSLLGTGNVLLGSQTLTINTGAGNDYSGIFSGTGGGFTLGGGAMTLSGANTYTGETNINAGTLEISNDDAMGTSIATVASGASLILNGVTIGNNLSLSGTGISNSGALATSGSSTVNGNVTLADNSLFNANTGDTLTINGSINGGHDLTINGAGNIYLQASDVGLVTPLNSLTVNVSGTVDLHNVATIGSQSYTGSAITAHSTYSASTGDLDFNSALTLLSDSTMTATAGNIHLNNTVDGAYALGMSAGTGIYINEAIGSGTALTSLTATGATQIGANITTTGTQTYNSAVTLTNNVLMTGSTNITNGISGAFNLNLAGVSNNTFTLAGALSVNNINVNGGTGTNTLYVNNNQNQTWTITGTDAGTVSGIAELPGTFTFANIQNWQSGSGVNTLAAANTANTWTVTGANAGTVTGLSSSFSNFQNLVGGSNTDSFTLNGGTLAGSIAGGAGANSLTGDAVANTWVITGADSGTVTGVAGGFSNIQNLTGGSSTDSFTLNGGTLSGSIAGGSGNDSLTADNVVNTWNISGANAGTVTGIAGGFSSIETITGGSNNDTFTFGTSGSLANLNGGSGSNLLDYSNYGSAVSFTIGGAATGITTSNSGLTQVIGSAIGNGTLTGANVANSWGITSDNAGSVTGLSGGFSKFNNLVGGTNNDTFTFTNGKKVTGTINGGAGGVNTLDLSNYTTTVGFVLSSASSNGFAGTTTGSPNPTAGFSNITAFTAAGTGTSSMTGLDVNSTWHLTGTNVGTYSNGSQTLNFSGMPRLIGGAANDTFIFDDGAGVTNILRGNSGTNTFDYSAYTTAVMANLGSNAQTGTLNATGVSVIIGGTTNQNLNTITAGSNNYTWLLDASVANAGVITASSSTPVTYSNFGNIVGGSSLNTFVFSPSSSITGTLSGGNNATATNTLNYSAFTSNITINLATSSAPGIAGGFVLNGPKSIIGGSGTNTIIGANTTNNWIMKSNTTGTINGTNVTYSNFKNLVGGTGDDNFKFNSTTVTVPSIDGGAGGNNTLDYTLYNNTVVNINLTSSSAAGATSIAHINNYIGSNSTLNTLTGSNSATTWNITGANAGTSNGSSFSNFGYLVGGTGVNTFNILSGGSISGKITGSGVSANNTISYNSYPSAVTVNLSTGTATGVTSFAGIGNFVGTSVPANSTLIGRNVDSAWNITNNNAGNVVISGSTYASFNQFANVLGGYANDTFVFSNGANIVTSLDGGLGYNTMDYSAYTTPVNVNVGSLSNVASILGSSSFAATNTLTGAASGNYTWTVTGANAGVISGSKSLSFSNFGTWTGGVGSTNRLVAQNVNNTWSITGNNAGNINNGIHFSGFANLQGGSANDAFVFSDGANVTGSLNGGLGGTNTLDYSAYTSPLTINLDTSAITNINMITANAAQSNTLAGSSSLNNWVINDTNSGILTINSGSGIAFVNFANLVGGPSTDNFVFTNNATVSSIAGGAGVNTYDYSDASNTNAVTINLSNGSINNITNFIGAVNITGDNTIIGPNSANAWFISGNNAGTINHAITFSHFGNLTGGGVSDNFVFGNASVGVTGTISSGTLDYTYYNSTPVNINLALGTASGAGSISDITNIIGSNGINTLTGANTANTWNLTGANSGNINGVVSFSNFRNLVGGSNNDTFNILDATNIMGSINGSTGTNTFNYSGYSAPVTVDLNLTSALGVAKFSNINNFVGNSSTVSNNIIIGENRINNIWLITANNAGTLNNAITFNQFGNITGGLSNDNFVFSDGKTVSGVINGGLGGFNTLDLSNYTTALTYTLTSSSLTGFNGVTSGLVNPLTSFANIASIKGGSSTNTLNTTNNQTIVNLTGSNSGTISGAIPLSFAGMTMIAGGTGNNIINAANSNNTWNITGSNAGNLNGTLSFTGFGNLLGGSSDDTFNFADGGSLSGNIKGGAGNNTINYANYASPVTVNLASSSSSGVLGSISSISNFVANNAINNTLIGQNTTNDWLISNTNAGNINNTYYFSGFGNLTGGSVADIFTFLDSISVTGVVDGGSGVNTMDYSNYTTSVNINLTNQTATGTGGFANVNNFVGETVNITP